MNPVEARDMEVRKEEFLSANPLVSVILIATLIIYFGFIKRIFPNLFIPFVLLMASAGYWYYQVQIRIKRRVFDHKGYELLWNNIKDRESRFKQVLESVRSYRPDDFASLQSTVDYTSNIVYQALRRADLINLDISRTEKSLIPANILGPSSKKNLGKNEEVQLLYRTADKNIAEYRQKMDALEQGMQLSEGQAAVYATMLDTLRAQLLGYKLLGNPTASDSDHFMSVIDEAKAQLRAVDEALEELDFESLANPVYHILDTVDPPEQLQSNLEFPPPFKGEDYYGENKENS